VGSFYERYKNGEREQVWAELLSYGEAIREDTRLFEDAVSVARETMSRTRYNIELLVERLKNLNYKFLLDDSTENPVPHTKPNQETTKLLGWIQQNIGAIPLSVQTFFEEVGRVNFIGAHPLLSEYSNHDVEYKMIVLSDPLCFDIWQEDFDDFENQDETESACHLELAPDIYHKANISGGAPLSILIPDTAADNLLHFWDGKGTFVEYLRHSLKWGGFPGLAMAEVAIRDKEQHIARLRQTIGQIRPFGINAQELKETLEREIELYASFTEADLPSQEIAYLTEGLLPI
jgi:hypothetical protein